MPRAHDDPALGGDGSGASAPGDIGGRASVGSGGVSGKSSGGAPTSGLGGSSSGGGDVGSGAAGDDTGGESAGAGGEAGFASGGSSSGGAGGRGGSGGAGGKSSGGAGGGTGGKGGGGSAGTGGGGGAGGAQGGGGTGGGAAGSGGKGGGSGAPHCADHPLTARGTWILSASDDNAGTSPATNLIDNTTSRWTTGTTQSGDEWLQIDFGQRVSLSYVNLQQSEPYKNDYPRQFAVRVSDTALDTAAPVLLSGSGTSGVSSAFSLPAIATGRFLLIKQLSTSLSWWSAVEIEVSCVD